jgi:membrane protein implicated in regulation of membrane protease activity
MEYLALAFTVQSVYLLCFLIGLFYAIVAGVLTGFFGGGEGAADVEAGGADVDVGGADLDVGGADVDVGGADLDVGGADVDVGGADVDVGGADVDVGGADVDVGEGDVDVGGAEADVGADTDFGQEAGVFEEAVDQGRVHFSPLSPIVIAMFLTAFGGAGLITTGALKWGAWTSVPISVLAGFGVAALTFVLFYKLVQATQASSEATVAGLVGEAGEVIVAVPRDGLGEIAYVSRGTRYTAPARSATGTTIAVNTPVVIRRIVGNTFYVAPKR